MYDPADLDGSPGVATNDLRKRIEALEKAMGRVSALLDARLTAATGAPSAPGRITYGIWPIEE